MRKLFYLTCCFLFTGCGFFSLLSNIFYSEDVIDPQLPVEDKRIAVIPFADDLFGHFESDIGEKIAAAIVTDVQANRDYTDLKEIFLCRTKELKRYFHFHYSEPDWSKVAELTQADWVLSGIVHEFRTTTEKYVGIYQGRAEVEFWVYDRKKKKEILRKKIQVFYPSRIEVSALSPTTSETEKVFQVEKGLIQKLGRQIGREFYSYIPEKLTE